MKITEDKISPVQLRLDVAVDEADYKDKVEKQLKEVGRKRTVPGFRPGHVPFGQLFKLYGKAVTSDVVNDVVYDAILNYVKENRLDVIGSPLPVEVKEVAVSGPQEFSFDVALMPALNVEPDKNLHVPYYEIEVTDKMIDEQDEMMRKRAGSQVPGDKMEKDAIVRGTLFQLNEDGTRNENEGAIQMTNGILFPMYFKDKEETAKFDNAKTGEMVRFNPYRASGGDAGEIASMLGIDKSIAPDIKGDFEVAISGFTVNKPAELGEEYYKTVFGDDKVKDEAAYRQAVKSMIANELRNESNMAFRYMFDKKFDDANQGIELPDELLEKIFFAKAENPKEAYEKEKAPLRNEIIKAVLKRKYDIKAEAEEVIAAFKSVMARQFAQYGIPMDDATLDKVARERIKEDNHYAEMAQQVENNKLYQKIYDTITLDRETLPIDDFKVKVQEFLAPEK